MIFENRRGKNETKDYIQYGSLPAKSRSGSVADMD